VMLLRGFVDAIMMRSQQALAFHAAGYLPPEHYDQIFSAHGTIMIFFGAMPLMIGLMNFVVPLQLGVRDVAFPTWNSTSFWLTATGALLVNLSLVIGEVAEQGGADAVGGAHLFDFAGDAVITEPHELRVRHRQSLAQLQKDGRRRTLDRVVLQLAQIGSGDPGRTCGLPGRQRADLPCLPENGSE